MFSFEAWWQILTTKLPVFFQGVGTTVELALCTAIFGTLLGIVVALLRMSRVKLLKVLAGAYIEFLRGTPLLVQVLIVFYGLPQMGVKLPRMTAGTVALVINSAAYHGRDRPFRHTGHRRGTDRGQPFAGHERRADDDLHHSAAGD